MIINLLSSPRNVSTALMYSFDQRPDTQVIDEPFYGYYLKHVCQIEHPGQEEIIESMETNFDRVLEDIHRANSKSSVVFVKNMAHHLTTHQVELFTDTRHVLFIRDPKEIIHSFAKVIPEPSLEDIGVKIHFDLYAFLKTKGQQPIVLSAEHLLKNPERNLSLLCRKLDIPFYREMLEWQKGARPEDGIWAKYWYANVHQSTGFKPYEKKEISLPPKLEALYQTALPYYLELHKHALTDASAIQ